MEWKPPEPALQSDEVVLRLLRLDDAPAVVEACRDPAIGRFTFMKEGLTLDEARRWIDDANSRWSVGVPRFAVADARSSRFLGQVGMAVCEPYQSAEMFYWVTVMFSQTLGTALGDWTADTAGLGYVGGAVVFGTLLALAAGAYYWARIPRTVWTAFILTRPLGAVVGDFLDKPRSAGGLALSRYSASAALLAFIVVCLGVFQHRAAKQSH